MHTQSEIEGLLIKPPVVEFPGQDNCCVPPGQKLSILQASHSPLRPKNAGSQTQSEILLDLDALLLFAGHRVRVVSSGQKLPAGHSTHVVWF